MVKMSFTNNQVAFDYVVYMMLGSYFTKTICKNHLLERKMRIQYLEQKTDRQYKMEDMCLEYIEKQLLPTIPEEVWQEKMEVHFYPQSKEKNTKICFVGPNYLLQAETTYNGKKSEISCKYNMRKKE